MFNIFAKPETSFLGVDVGTTGIRVVQLGKKDKKIVLENYASIETKDYLEILGNDSKFNNIRVSDQRISEDLGKIFKDAGINSKKISMSVPISSAFSSIMTLPDMPNSEVEKAINFEARQYIPIPIEEVVFDWTIIGKDKSKEGQKYSSRKKNVNLKILLVAIPREIMNKYINIAKSLNLELIALETESFSLARSFSSSEDEALTIVDIGNKTIGISIVDKGVVMSAHSVSGAGGGEITKIISHGVNVNFHRAEKLKMDVGFDNNESQKQVSDLMLPIISVIISEIRKISESYMRTNKKSIKKVIITGRTAYISGLAEHFTKQIGITTEVGNPWKKISYDPILDKKLSNLSQFFSVSVGLALRGIYDKG